MVLKYCIFKYFLQMLSFARKSLKKEAKLHQRPGDGSPDTGDPKGIWNFRACGSSGSERSNSTSHHGKLRIIYYQSKLLYFYSGLYLMNIKTIWKVPL